MPGNHQPSMAVHRQHGAWSVPPLPLPILQPTQDEATTWIQQAHPSREQQLAASAECVPQRAATQPAAFLQPRPTPGLPAAAAITNQPVPRPRRRRASPPETRDANDLSNLLVCPSCPYPHYYKAEAQLNKHHRRAHGSPEAVLQALVGAAAASPGPCSLCGRGFATALGLRSHLKAKHGLDKAPGAADGGAGSAAAEGRRHSGRSPDGEGRRRRGGPACGPGLVRPSWGLSGPGSAAARGTDVADVLGSTAGMGPGDLDGRHGLARQGGIDAKPVPCEAGQDLGRDPTPTPSTPAPAYPWTSPSLGDSSPLLVDLEAGEPEDALCSAFM
ncbi:hypothetical protein P8C59_005943 [Phyllachora maydis]|uniref:C2H2-type domain-containing protein n=1 Tax=Phyllachora maydis TaxID=1825666 RepID=A0AAD9I5I3_9PEZI|nr:hypothetical protein P8C59_005943 [Phyllachora maydis]